jgi:hypothetical protein
MLSERGFNPYIHIKIHTVMYDVLFHVRSEMERLVITHSNITTTVEMLLKLLNTKFLN